MKKIVFLISILLVSFSCRKLEDLSINAKDGAKGETYLSLWQFDPVANTDKCWLDYNQDGKYTPDLTGVKSGKPDSLMIVHTLSGIDYVPSSTPGCFELVITNGNNKVTKEVCNGNNGNDGHNGTNGKDAHEFVIGSRPQTDGSQLLDFYWDTRGEGFGLLTPNDTLKYTLIIPKPEKGDKGDTPLFQVNIEKIGNKIVYSVTTIEGTKTASADIPYQTVYSVTPFTDMKGDTTMNLLKGFADLDGSRTVNMGDSLLFTLPVKNGTRGDRGYTEVTKVTPIMDGTTVVGNHFDKYLDIDGIPGYSSGDQPLYSGYDILNGLTGATGATGDTGPRGPAGETPIVEWNIGLTSTTSSGNVEIVFSLTINGETKTATVEIPRAEVEHGGHVRCEKKDHKNTFSWCGGNDNNDHSHDRKLGECNDN
jgi:hypothetical protein